MTLLGEVKKQKEELENITGERPVYLLVDRLTFQNMERGIEEYWPAYEQANPDIGDRYNGLIIAVIASDIQTIKVY